MTNLRKTESSVPDPAAKRRAAFGLLARKYEADMLRLARRLCRGDNDRAADHVQEALVRAYQFYAAGRFDDSANARPWLLRIVTNLFINDLNRRTRWEAPTDYETLTAHGESGPTATRASPDDMPGVRLFAETLDEELERALTMLSEGLRLCIILVDIEEMDYAEAAAALGIPVGTVRSRLSRARMQLQDMLRDYAVRRGLISP